MNLVEETKNKFSSFIILNQVIEQGITYDTYLDGDNQYLEPILEFLLQNQHLQIIGSSYQVTLKGKTAYEDWMKHYYDWMPKLEVFSAVDLEKGEFAFTRYWDFPDDQSWDDHLNQSRFEDLRVAICEFREIDPVEIIFMNFLNQGKWQNLLNTPGWQFDLTLGKFWNEVAEIIKKAIKIEQLGYQDGSEFISGKDVISDIINQGEELQIQLWEEEKKRKAEQNNNQDNSSLKLEEGLDDAYRL